MNGFVVISGLLSLPVALFSPDPCSRVSGRAGLRELRIGELEEVLSLQKRERDPELSCELK